MLFIYYTAVWCGRKNRKGNWKFVASWFFTGSSCFLTVFLCSIMDFNTNRTVIKPWRNCEATLNRERTIKEPWHNCDKTVTKPCNNLALSKERAKEPFKTSDHKLSAREKDGSEIYAKCSTFLRNGGNFHTSTTATVEAFLFSSNEALKYHYTTSLQVLAIYEKVLHSRKWGSQFFKGTECWRMVYVYIRVKYRLHCRIATLYFLDTRLAGLERIWD